MALTQYYVDPAINANSGTGTSGDPYGDLQYALNTVTRDATNGDQFNVKAGTAEVLGAALSLSTYGTPTAAAPLFIRGYTSAANDGGIGDISGADSYTIIDSATATKSYIALIDLYLHNVGGRNVVKLYTYSSLVNCEVAYNTGANYAVSIATGSCAYGCYIHDTDYGISNATGAAAVIGCRLAPGSSTMVRAVNAGAAGLTVLDNIISLAHTGTQGIYLASAAAVVIGNTIYNSAAGTAGGIVFAGSQPAAIIANNVIAGFSGSGGEAIDFNSNWTSLYSSNAWYNVTAGETTKVNAILDTNNDALGSSPWVDASGGDFDINGTIAGVTEDGYANTWRGLSSTTGKRDKGAVQAGAGAGTTTAGRWLA